jgi:hypothetical protein
MSVEALEAMSGIDEELIEAILPTYVVFNVLIFYQLIYYKIEVTQNSKTGKKPTFVLIRFRSIFLYIKFKYFLILLKLRGIQLIFRYRENRRHHKA